MPAALDIKEEILELKKQRNAVILAHNYQTGDIQDLADYVGDSLGLAYQAKSTDADVIVFCGVHFMAETAKIVNPGKIVVLPDKDAGCSLEQSCPAEQLEAFLKENAGKNYYVIAYINCSGAVKALCDVICTSGNAVKIVEQAPPDRPILNASRSLDAGPARAARPPCAGRPTAGNPRGCPCTPPRSPSPGCWSCSPRCRSTTAITAA